MTQPIDMDGHLPANKRVWDLPFSPLGLACYLGERACVEILLKRGADANGKDFESTLSPLKLATWNNRDHETRLKLRIGCDQDLARDDQASAKLRQARVQGKAKCIEALLDAGADIKDSADPTGMGTPLMFASWWSLDLMELLARRAPPFQACRQAGGLA